MQAHCDKGTVAVVGTTAIKALVCQDVICNSSRAEAQPKLRQNVPAL